MLDINSGSKDMNEKAICKAVIKLNKNSCNKMTISNITKNEDKQALAPVETCTDTEALFEIY